MSLESFDFLRVLSAAGLSFLAMTALIAGTFIGIFTRASQRTNAIIMAFGTGALIQALAIDLAYHGANRLIEKLAFSGMDAWLMVSMGFLLGGLAYYLTNKALEKNGAAIRHPALAKFYFLQKKRHEQSQVLENFRMLNYCACFRLRIWNWCWAPLNLSILAKMNSFLKKGIRRMVSI